MLQVGGTKFKVHRHFLTRDSVYFQELFAGPLGDFGARDNEAIPLEGVTSAEFECLLDFFYNGCVPSVYTLHVTKGSYILECIVDQTYLLTSGSPF
jgi:hypothetical protein